MGFFGRPEVVGPLLEQQGREIAAVELVRQHTALGLKEAEDAVEGLA